LVEGDTILLAFEGTWKEQTVQGTPPAVLEASTLINLGSRAQNPPMIFGWYEQVGRALKFCLGRTAGLGLVE
jgi:hypothetical protein